MPYEPEQGYSLKSMRETERGMDLYEVLDVVSDKFDRLRSRITKESKNSE
jgi:hypothetical protein